MLDGQIKDFFGIFKKQRRKLLSFLIEKEFKTKRFIKLFFNFFDPKFKLNNLIFRRIQTLQNL